MMLNDEFKDWKWLELFMGDSERIENLTGSDEKFHEDELFNLGISDFERIECQKRFVKTFGESK